MSSNCECENVYALLKCGKLGKEDFPSKGDYYLACLQVQLIDATTSGEPPVTVPVMGIENTGFPACMLDDGSPVFVEIITDEEGNFVKYVGHQLGVGRIDPLKLTQVGNCPKISNTGAC